MKEFPPKRGAGKKASPPGIPAEIRAAREAQGLTWYALAKRAGIPNQATIRDIEQGKDGKPVVHLDGWATKPQFPNNRANNLTWGRPRSRGLAGMESKK